jgi:hypothetical protein
VAGKGSSSPESSATGGLLVLVPTTAALAAVGSDIVEARDESLGPESSKTMAGPYRGGRETAAREEAATLAETTTVVVGLQVRRCEVRVAAAGRTWLRRIEEATGPDKHTASTGRAVRRVSEIC